MIQKNQVGSFLREQGYLFVSFDTGYDLINIPTADIFEHSPNVKRVNPQAAFELMLLDTTLGKIYLRARGKDYTPLQSLFDEHRERVIYTLTHLARYADQEGDYFICAHVISPHSPYVFGLHGEARTGVDPFTLLSEQSSEPWSPNLYTDQVRYINTLVLPAIDQILENSDPKPIIILQADHSSRAYSEREVSSDLRMKLLLPIFNAYYLPDADGSQLIYPTITPVNSFRAIFNHYFGTHLKMLEDTSYIMEIHEGKPVFTNACVTYQGCR